MLLFYAVLNLQGECDYECTGEIETGLYGTAEIPFKSINDDITLEYDDKVKMVFAPLYENYRQELMENGEFIRAYSYVHIIDNDGKLYINVLSLLLVVLLDL